MNSRPVRIVLSAVLATGIACLATLPLSAAEKRSRGFREVEKDSAPYTALVGGEHRALLIGNNDYGAGKWPDLKTAVQDMAWSKHHDGVKMIFLVGDAPPHTDYEDLPSCMDSAAAANELGISISTLGAGGIAAGGPGRELWEKLAEETYGSFEALSRGGGYAMAPAGLAMEAEEMAFADGAGGGAVLRTARSASGAAPAPSSSADFSRIVVEGVREKTREALAKRRR